MAVSSNLNTVSSLWFCFSGVDILERAPLISLNSEELSCLLVELFCKLHATLVQSDVFCDLPPIDSSTVFSMWKPLSLNAVWDCDKFLFSLADKDLGMIIFS